ncbi:MAG: DUF3568 domain-containing protein [Verrucomicrobiae bacterium]|nr:DUF3568 domain-containing protein [Verrucomicrobiae bacterium]
MKIGDTFKNRGKSTNVFSMLIYLSLFSALIITLSGCAAVVVGAGAGAGAYAYSKGELQSAEAASLDKVYKAVEKTVAEMNFVLESKSKDALVGEVICKGAGDKTIKIKLKFITDKTTEIRIRVGFWGDENFSYQILKKIRDNL